MSKISHKLLLLIVFSFISIIWLSSHAKSKDHAECIAFVNKPSEYDTCRFGEREYTGSWSNSPMVVGVIESLKTVFYGFLVILFFAVIGFIIYMIIKGMRGAKDPTQIIFENPKTGQSRIALVGFSWTTLLFGPFPMIFRSNWKRFVIILLIGFFTLGISNIFFAFVVNKMHVKDLINDGFKVKSVEHGTIDEVAREFEFPLPILESYK